MKKQLYTILALALTFGVFAQSVSKEELAKQKKEEIKKREAHITKQLVKDIDSKTVDQKKQQKPFVISGSQEYTLLKAENKLAHYEVRMGSNGKLQTVNMSARTATATTPCDYIPYVGSTINFTNGFNPLDDSYSTIALPFTFCFYGNNYTAMNVTVNGNVQFSTNSTAFSSTGFPSNAVNMIAPFWADCYLTSGSAVKIDMYPTRVVISWDSLGYYNDKNDKTNSFQCVLTDGIDGILPPGKNVGFYYKKMQWTTGDASSGTNGFPGATGTRIPATVGVNAGNGTDYYLIGRFGQPGSAYDGPLGSDDGVSWLNGKKFYFNVCPPVGANLEPVANLIGYCDTLKVCGNDTLYIKNTFIGPELTQTVSVTVTSVPAGTNTPLGASFTYSTIPGPNSSTDVYMVVNANTAPAGSSGYHTITMTATDNGSPAQTSVQTFVVYFDQVGINNLTGNIILSPACAGGTVNASVNVMGGTVTEYLWNNNSNSATTSYSTVAGGDSLVFVTVKTGQCKKTFTNYISIRPLPVASIAGIPSVCSGISPNTVLTATNTLNNAAQAPYTYNWSSSNPIGSVTTSTISAIEGVYTTTVTNRYGCVSTSSLTVLLNESPTYSITTNAVGNGSVYCLSQDTARLAFHYPTSTEAPCALSNTGTNDCIFSTVILTGTATTTGSGSTYNPYAGLWEGAHHQYLYRASELIASGVRPGKLSSLAFNITSLNGGNTSYSNFTIKLKCTSDNSLNTTAMDYTNLVQVYGPPVTPVVVGWNTYNFSQPYIWDGVSNILVDVCYYEPDWNGDNIVQFTNVGYDATRYDYWDDDICGDAYVDGTTQIRPNTRFGNCVTQQLASQFNVTVTPTLGVVIPATKDSIKIDIPSTPSTICYTISVSNPLGGCTRDTVVCVQGDQGVTNATFTPSSNTVCAGASVILNASGAETYTMSYIQGGVPVVLTNNSTYTHTPVQTGLNVYSLTAVGFCGAAPATYTLGVNVLPVANLVITPSQDVTKCLDTPYIIYSGVGSTTSGNSGAPYSYVWSTLPGNTPAPGTNTSSSYTVNTNATTTLVVTATGVCASTVKDTIVIKNFVNNLVTTVPDSLTICSNKEFTTNAQVIGGYPNYKYLWYISGNSNPVAVGSGASVTSPANEGIYLLSVYVTDSCGYTGNDYQVVKVLPPCDVVIPNVVTANGDGANDIFKIKNLEHHPNTVVSIFDRWGRKVYENSNYQNDWKADNVSDGTYFYVIDVPDDKKYNGFITIFHSK